MKKKIKKHELCASQSRFCSPKAELVKVDLCGDKFLFCTVCMADLEKKAGEQMAKPRPPERYSTMHGTPTKAFTKTKVGRKCL